MSELKPCPFCGNTRANYIRFSPTAQVRCTGCGAEGPEASAVSMSHEGLKAVAAWNARDESAELARLRAAIAEFVDVAEDVVNCSPIEDSGRLVSERDIARLHALVLRHTTEAKG